MGESEKALYYEKVQNDGLGLTGCCRAMFSNRISYWLGIHGKLKCAHNNVQLLRKLSKF